MSILKEPRKKGHSNQRVGNPLPVLVESETGIPAHLAIWRACSGRFNGDCVEVSDAEDIYLLYNSGFFGKGLLSRSCPRSARKTKHPEIVRESQWKRRCEWSALQEGLSAKKDESSMSSSNPQQDTEVIVIANNDTEGEDFISQLQPRLEKNSNLLPEVLNLLLEEALFLIYGLGCLYIFDSYGQKSLSCLDFWALCVESDPRFIQRYVAYHHFRSKGWVVKSGLKFGGDFLLYKDGPGFYHASYVVQTKVIFGPNSVETGQIGEKNMDWVTLMGLNRLAETSGKEVLFCYVIWPSDIIPNKPTTPDIIKNFKVHEVLMRRWQSSIARIESSGSLTKQE